jgi:hypothetical protein
MEMHARTPPSYARKAKCTREFFPQAQGVFADRLASRFTVDVLSPQGAYYPFSSRSARSQFSSSLPPLPEMLIS